MYIKDLSESRRVLLLPSNRFQFEFNVTEQCRSQNCNKYFAKIFQQSHGDNEKRARHVKCLLGFLRQTILESTIFKIFRRFRNIPTSLRRLKEYFSPLIYSCFLLTFTNYRSKIILTGKFNVSTIKNQLFKVFLCNRPSFLFISSLHKCAMLSRYSNAITQTRVSRLVAKGFPRAEVWQLFLIETMHHDNLR